MTSQWVTHTLNESHFGKRLDQVLAMLYPDYSRSRLQQWIKSGWVRLDDEPAKAKLKLRGNEQLQVNEAEAMTEVEAVQWRGQDIPLDIVYEDEQLLIINKAANHVVHPGAGNPEGTLVNALLGYAPELAALPRAGLIHRIDKDTTGLLVIARTIGAHTRLVDQLQQRAFQREYDAIVNGVMTAGGTIDEPIGRHPVHRTRMAVAPGGKPAVTHYRVVERYRAHTRVRVKLETGRTHQIRVHMAYIRYPIVGDQLYGGRLKVPPSSSDTFISILRQFKRQALHAALLGLEHPETGEWMQWEAPMPADMLELIAALEQDKRENDFDEL